MTVVPQPTRADESVAPSRWVERTLLSRVLRFAIWLVPVVLSALVIAVAARRWPPKDLGMGSLMWWLLFGAIAFAVLLFTDRVARRFLPVPMLLRMALVFPDAAPSRFGAALRYGTAKQLLSRNPPTSQGLLSLVQALSRHDRATRGHSERVRAYSQLIGQELGLSQADMDRLSWAALLHDVGKLDVSAEILNKNGRPDEAEWDELQQHPAKAPPYLDGFEHWLGDWARAASEHHERWDGKGYPNGLAGEEIHQAGRIVAVADAYDVMTSVRSYKKPMSTQLAREEVARNAGTQFDPAVVRAFLNVGIGQVSTKWGALGWLTQVPDFVSRVPATGLVVALAMGASLGLIDPDAVPVADPVAIVAEPTPTATPTPPASAAPAPAGGQVDEPTATSTPTPTSTATAAPATDSEVASGSDAGSGEADGAPNGVDSPASPTEEPSPTPQPTPTAPNSPPLELAPPTATPVVAATPTAGPSPSPTPDPVVALLGGVPTPAPTVDALHALFGPPTVAPVGPPRLVRPQDPTPTPTATPTPTPTPTATPTPTPTPTATPTPTPTPTATPTPTPTPTPPLEVAFFDGQNLTGDQLGPLVLGSYPWPFIRDVPGGSWNDRISSMQVPAGLQVTACLHGIVPAVPTDCQVFIGDQLVLPAAFNNSISTFTISAVP